nr:uncharacterized protein LOC112025760 [Quercus suber]
MAAPGRTGTRPSRVLSVAQLPAEESQSEPKRARRGFHLILSFSEEDKIGTIQPHDDALVITLRIGDYDVKRVMVDGGSAVEVMYPDLYKGLGLKLDDLTPYSSPLMSFDGKLVIPKGMIRLSIQTGPEVVEEKTAFVTPVGNYYYKVMPFGLKNTGSTYQRMMTRMFEPMLGKSIEVYVDDMVVKSKVVSEYFGDLGRTFDVLRKHKLRLNASKCSFSVGSGKFLGYMITHRGIEVDPDQIKAIHNLKPPQNPKEVQKLTGMIAALNRFISRSAYRCRPFYLLINKWKGFEWSEDCAMAFQQLKKYLSRPPIMSNPKANEVLYAYLAVALHVMSLNREVEHNSGGLRRQIHASDLHKGQVLANLTAEFAEPTVEVAAEERSVDEKSVGAVSIPGVTVLEEKSLRLGFMATNNEAEYEALLQGMIMVQKIEGKSVQMFSDSILVVGQVKGELEARDSRMQEYLSQVRQLQSEFGLFSLSHIPRSGNTHADSLATLATSSVGDLP